MAVAVVDLLEMVDIDEQDAIARSAGRKIAMGHRKAAAIENARLPVAESQTLQLLRALAHPRFQ